MQSARAGVNAKLVVVIDNDPLVLDALGGLLRQWGYAVVAVASDSAAFAQLAARRRSPDLIVCDYHLSNGATGIDAIKRLRRVFRIPAVLISADVSAAASVQVHAHDVRVLRKPVDVKMLRAMLRQALGKAGRQ